MRGVEGVFPAARAMVLGGLERSNQFRAVAETVITNTVGSAVQRKMDLQPTLR